MSTSSSNTRKSNLFQNDKIALSMNSFSKSLHTDSNLAVFNSAMLDGLACISDSDSVAQSRSTRYCPIDFELAN